MASTTWTQTAGMTSSEDTDNLESYAEQAEASKDAAAVSAAAAEASKVAAAASEAAALASKNSAAISATTATTGAATATTKASEAATSATSASTSATEAQTAQTAAEAAETAAAASETASAASAAAASTSETNATSSASAASASETNAATSASAASASETNAATSETNAASSASAASTSETNAAASETAAAASETAAATSETNAASSASAASTSASNAATSESNAASSASAASTSETNAATSASNASTSETNAASSASAASTSASEAAASVASINLSSIDIDGGTIDGTVIGGTTPAAGTFTTLTANTSLGGTLSTAAQPNVTSVGTLTSLDVSGNATFGDNDKAIFGAGSDLQIFHNGNNSIVSDNGTGVLVLAGDSSVRLAKSNLSEVMIEANADGRVKLYYDNAQKLATTSTGVDITGTLTSDGLTVDGNAKIQFGTSDTTGIYRTNSGNDLTLQHWGNASVLIDSDNNDSGTRSFLIGSDSQDRSTAKSIAKFADGGDISFYEATGTTPKFFWDASAEKARFGGGTSDDFAGSIGLSGQTFTIEGYINNSLVLNAKPNSVNEGVILQYNGTDGLILNNAGNVGIGTDSPDFAVEVERTSGNAQLSLKSQNTGYSEIYLGDTDAVSVGAISYDHPNNAMKLYINSSERMRIGSTGNVGIGTTTAAERLSVVSSDTYQLSFKNNSASSTGALGYDSTDNMRVYVNGSERMRIDSSGNLLVGTTGLGTGKVQVLSPSGTNDMALFRTSTLFGNIIFQNSSGVQVGYIQTNASATAYVTSSDYRLKTDAQPMTGASARVQALKPINFEWIADGTRVDGFLAHEAQAVVPEAVTGTKDAMRDEEYEVTPAILDEDGNVVTEAVMGTRSVPDYQGIDQSKLVPLLTAALQEALTEIADLKVRITALEG